MDNIGEMGNRLEVQKIFCDTVQKALTLEHWIWFINMGIFTKVNLDVHGMMLITAQSHVNFE